MKKSHTNSYNASYDQSQQDIMNLDFKDSDKKRLRSIKDLVEQIDFVLSSEKEQDAYSYQLFQTIDEDRSGKITYIELMVAFSQQKCKFDARLEREFKECDENQDGLIDRDEFSRYLRKCLGKIHNQLNLKFSEIFNLNESDVDEQRKKMIQEGRKEDESEFLNKLAEDTMKYDLLRYNELLKQRESVRQKILDLYQKIDEFIRSNKEIKKSKAEMLKQKKLSSELKIAKNHRDTIEAEVDKLFDNKKFKYLVAEQEKKKLESESVEDTTDVPIMEDRRKTDLIKKLSSKVDDFLKDWEEDSEYDEEEDEVEVENENGQMVTMKLSKSSKMLHTAANKHDKSESNYDNLTTEASQGPHMKTNQTVKTLNTEDSITDMDEQDRIAYSKLNDEELHVIQEED